MAGSGVVSLLQQDCDRFTCCSLKFDLLTYVFRCLLVACTTYDSQICQTRGMCEQCQKTDFELLLVRKRLGVQPSRNLFIRCEYDWHPVMQPAQPWSISTPGCFWQCQAHWRCKKWLMRQELCTSCSLHGDMYVGKIMKDDTFMHAISM